MKYGRPIGVVHTAEEMTGQIDWHFAAGYRDRVAYLAGEDYRVGPLFRSDDEDGGGCHFSVAVNPEGQFGPIQFDVSK